MVTKHQILESWSQKGKREQPTLGPTVIPPTSKPGSVIHSPKVCPRDVTLLSYKEGQGWTL